MAKDSIDALEVLFVVAREQSFTRAAAKLGISQPALSQSVRELEEKIGIRLLDRTTRSVSPTEAGRRLLETVAPRIQEIREELSAISALRNTPSGTVRITADEYAAKAALWPRLGGVLARYPDIHIEIIVDYGLTDIVAENFDAGVRLGEIIAKDMITVPIGGDERMIVVGAPSYIADRGIPEHPQDLVEHRCINLRLPTKGGLYAWEFEKDGREVRVRVNGQCTFNSLDLKVKAAIEGFGFAFVPEGEVRELIQFGKLQTVLEDWCPSYPGYRLYYPSRRQPSAAFTAVVEALRHRS